MQYLSVAVLLISGKNHEREDSLEADGRDSNYSSLRTMYSIRSDVDPIM